MATERATPNLGHVCRPRQVNNLGRVPGNSEALHRGIIRNYRTSLSGHPDQRNIHIDHPARKNGHLGLMGRRAPFRLTVIGHRLQYRPASLDWLEKRVDTHNHAEAIVRVDGLRKTYGRLQALDGVGFSIRAGEILGLIGPNGAGKTTLFECVAGLEPPDRGEIFFGPVPVDGRHRSSKLFYVPDGIAPWPDQPVRWALEYSLGFFGGRRDIVEHVIADLALAPLMRVPIRALSKGQRKRTLLALGLLAPQPILLIDEPFEGLDLRQSREAAATLRKHLTLDRTFFLSIHQIADAAKVCDRFVLLSSGRVVAEGALDTLTALARQRAGHDLPPDFEEVFLALT
jgi:ABC-2 type transport system ATP-binding protein